MKRIHLLFCSQAVNSRFIVILMLAGVLFGAGVFGANDGANERLLSNSSLDLSSDDVTVVDGAEMTDSLNVVQEPQKVYVGLYLLNLGKFDVSTGSYTADFYLSFQCESECDPKIEFMNGRAASIDKTIDEPTEKFYRISANLNNLVDLKQFPFDSQKLIIALEDKEKGSEELIFVVDDKQSGIDPSITFTGWRLDGFDVQVVEHNYDVYNETFSQYEYSIGISRIMWNSFLKTFLPVIFIVLIVLFSFVLDPDKVSTRLAMAGSSLVASVMFHISITNQIPPVGYLTFADKFMALTYLVLLIAFVINIALLELQERKKLDLVEKIHRKTEFAMFIVVPLLYLLLFLLAF